MSDDRYRDPYRIRLAKLEHEIRRQRAMQAAHGTREPLDGRAFDTIRSEHDRRVTEDALHGHAGSSILEDLRFDFKVLALDLRRFFSHPFKSKPDPDGR